jgi:gas vesicle protein
MSMLKTIFGADTSRLNKGLDQAKGRVQKFSRGVSRQLGAAFSVAAIGFFFRNLTNKLDRVGKLARRGFSTDFIQDLSQAADMAGSSVDALLPKILTLFREINNGTEPSRQMVQALESLNLSVEDLRGLSPEQLFNRVVQGLQESANKGQAAAAAMTLLRDRSGELLPVLQQLSEEGLRPAARASEDAVRSAEILNDTWTVLSNNLQTIAAPVLVFVTRVLIYLKGVVEAVSVTLIAFIVGVIKGFKQLTNAAMSLLKLDFEGFRDSIRDVANEFDLMFATIDQGLQNAIRGVYDFEQQMKETLKPIKMEIGAATDDIEPETSQTVKQKIEPSALADSLQRIGGGGRSVVAIQRDESIRLAQGQLEELRGIRSAIEQLESERMQ